jgi:putative hydrolases of HD superfamily
MKEWIEDLYRLKETARAGWLRIGIEHPESVADHSFATGLIAWRLAKREGLDETRVLLMALLHDFHEARLGDIPSPDKRKMGKALVMDSERLTEAQQWANDPEIVEMLEDLRRGESPEARLVGAVDSLELLLQSKRYRNIGFEGAEDFIQSILNSNSLEQHSAVTDLLRELDNKKNPPPKGEDRL